MVWHVTIISMPAPWVAEHVLVDAQSGEIALRCPLVRNALDREIYDAGNSLLGVRRRTDGTPPYLSVADVDSAYDGLGYAYDFHRSLHGRDGVDNAGALLKAFVRICYPNESCPWHNAGWIGEGYNCMFLGEGFVTDDVVAHEFAHGITGYESGLLYMNESGSIDESLADVGGEFVDLTNGSGNDSDEVKWLIGEDLPGGAIRNMSQPSARPHCQADRRKSENWKSLPSDVLPSAGNDYGYVHNNCGVGNKLCCLLTDGGTFNGYHIDAMDIGKVDALYYEVQTNHLLPCAADYNDLYFALTRAAGNMEWTSAEELNLEHACRAVEIAVGQEASSASVTAETRVKTASVLYAANAEPAPHSTAKSTNRDKPEAVGDPARRSVHESARAPSLTTPDREGQVDIRRSQADTSEPLPRSAVTEATASNRPWYPARVDPIPKRASPPQARTDLPTLPPAPQRRIDSAHPADAVNPDKTTETLRFHAWTLPQVISRRDRESLYVLVLVRLPGISQDAVDEMQRLALYPEGIRAVAQIANRFESQDTSGTGIWAVFDRKMLLGTVLENGYVTLRFTGTPGTGQRFQAISEIQVTQ